MTASIKRSRTANRNFLSCTKYISTCSDLTKTKLFSHSGLVHSKRERTQSISNNAISVKSIKLVNPKQHFKNSIQHRQCITVYSKRQLRSASGFRSGCKSHNKPVNTPLLLTAEDSKPEGLALLHPSIPTTKADKIYSVKRTRAQTPFCRFYEFARMPAYDMGVPCVRAGSAYKSREELVQEEYKRTKKKWITAKGFIPYGYKNEEYKAIKNYVTQDPSEPPVLHNFRPVDKNKWIAGRFKLICIE
eukprot:TRINITY_DN13745_c0_g4_i1.p2 TRINITY_DN13745_c0_g4~~TRINITY_DN13745_c0_g4_i1.p2  ORF type:complete len:246 (+),score=43.73 TRINITY_DN13745_c0_g4_i1:1180-1917(+)